MFNTLRDHLDNILELYTQGEYFEELKSAKEKYFALTGKIDEDRDEFESRMNCFNDWYIFQYRKKDGLKVIEDYIRKVDLNSEMAQAFLNVNHSLFEFSKISLKKQIILKDILHLEKVSLLKEHPHIGLVEGDFFTGRVVKFNGESFLLKGVCTLPAKVKSVLKKESKKVRGENSFDAEHDFLLNLENMKTKMTHYSHLDPMRIFSF